MSSETHLAPLLRSLLICSWTLGLFCSTTSGAFCVGDFLRINEDGFELTSRIPRSTRPRLHEPSSDGDGSVFTWISSGAGSTNHTIAEGEEEADCSAEDTDYGLATTAPTSAAASTSNPAVNGSAGGRRSAASGPARDPSARNIPVSSAVRTGPRSFPLLLSSVIFHHAKPISDVVGFPLNKNDVFAVASEKFGRAGGHGPDRAWRQRRRAQDAAQGLASCCCCQGRCR